MVEVSIIIVNYRSWEHLSNCLTSLGKINNFNLSYEVIVVDNKSDDGILVDFKIKFPTVYFIENSGNNGYANGCNVGAKNSQGAYLLFLNPDTIIGEKPIFSMLQLAKENVDYGIISCETINKKGKTENQVRFLPRLSTLFGLFRAIYKLLNRTKIIFEYNTSRKIISPEWVSGSLIFMSKIWFQKVNGWNEDYWMYFEDVDLCKRVQENGGKIVLTREVSIIHNHGGATRLNIKTAVLTKTEVLISKHVYIHNNFKGFIKYFSQFLVIFQNLITYFILAIVGVIFFFIPKLRLNIYLFKKLITSYLYMIIESTWLSKKSMNYK